MATCFAVAPCLANFGIETGGETVIATQLCASGRTINISIPSGDSDNNMPNHNIGACHAVCTESEESDED